MPSPKNPCQQNDSNDDKQIYSTSFWHTLDKSSGAINKCFIISAFEALNLFNRKLTKAPILAACGAFLVNTPYISRKIFDVFGQHSTYANFVLTMGVSMMIEKIFADNNSPSESYQEKASIFILGFLLNQMKNHGAILSSASFEALSHIADSICALCSEPTDDFTFKFD